MKGKKTSVAGSASRGKVALAFLACATVLVTGALIAGTTTCDIRSARPSGVDLLSQAKLAFVDGELTRAEELARQFLSAQPEDRSAKAFLARVLSERGHLEESKDLFATLLKADPQDFQATFGMARALKGLGQGDYALVYFRRASQLRPGDPAIWKEMGLLQKEMGEILEALSSLQQSLSLDPKQADLSHLMTEMATGRERLVGGSQARGRIGSFDPLNPKPIDPASLIPRPQVPDPLQWTQRPGGISR